MLSFIQVDVSGNTITQYVDTRHCHRVLFWKRCHTDHDARGFTTDELMAMQNGLLYYGYSALLNEINTLEPQALAFE